MFVERSYSFGIFEIAFFRCIDMNTIVQLGFLFRDLLISFQMVSAVVVLDRETFILFLR